jgi:hypothetical protein
MRRHIHIVGFGMLLMCLLLSCDPEDLGIVQPYSAGANGAITSQVIFGGERSSTSIWHWAVHADGSIFFFGCVNDLWSNILWQRGQPFYVKALATFESLEWDGGYALVAVSNSSDTELNELAHGIIAVYDRNGTMAIHKLVAHPEYDIRIEGMRLLAAAQGRKIPFEDPPHPGRDGRPMFFVTGGARKDGTTYPYCGLFEIMSDSTILFVKQRIFTELPDQYFMRAEWNATASSPAYFASSSAASSECPDWQSSAGGACWSDSVICLDDTLAIKWSCGVPPQNTLRSHIRALEYYDGSIYAVGKSKVTKSDGQEWTAGFVASIAESGSLKWSNSIILSDHGDYYQGAAIHQGTLYAAGILSEVWSAATNRIYGLALVSRFSLPAGEVVSHSTFGNSSYASGFNAVEIIGASMLCGGYTRCYMDEYGFQGWFVNIDTSLLMNHVASSPVPAAMRGEEARPSSRADQ